MCETLTVCAPPPTHTHTPTTPFCTSWEPCRDVAPHLGRSEIQGPGCSCRNPVPHLSLYTEPERNQQKLNRVLIHERTV